MSIKSKIMSYRLWKSGVQQCTFDPEGNGAVRMHLIPPRFSLFRSPSWVLILNGYYVIPLGYSWGILLDIFLKEVNSYANKELNNTDIDDIVNRTSYKMHSVFPFEDKEVFCDDLSYMVDVLFKIARNEAPNANIEGFSIREYRKNMYAPHRMDLMISAMYDANGRWKCNHKCRFCYACDQDLSAAEELSTEEWKSIIDKLKHIGVPMLTFTGGEPTLRGDLVELIDYSKWFVTRLNTNGVLLDRMLCERLKASSLDSLQITLYSNEKTIHNSLVGANTFDKTVEGIKNAVAVGLDVSINTPLCNLNSDYCKTLAFIKSLGVRFVTTSGIIAIGAAENKTELNDLSEDELFTILNNAQTFCLNNGMELEFTSPGLVSADKLESIGLRVPMCGAALSNMAVAPNGIVIPCQSWLSDDAGLGRILYSDWKRIWNHPLSKRLRDKREIESLNCPFRGNKYGQK